MKDFDRFFQAIYKQPLANRKNWYADSTVAYAEYRAPYVENIIEAACREFANITKPQLLEIGSGPGNATQHFAQRDYDITCIEPNPIACEFAQERFQAFPNVQIINGTFEEWSAQNNRLFDGAIASTSFHWLNPDTRCQNVANLLKPQGKIVLLWCTAPQPHAEIYQHLEPLYQEYLPSFADYENVETQRQNITKVSKGLPTSGYFYNLNCEQITATRLYKAEEYLSLLTTLSPYIALQETRRKAFLQALRTVFQQQNINQISTQYICAAHVATKVIPNL